MSSLQLPTPSIVAAQVVRCVTASISLLASTILALTILYSPTGRKSPYSRIIFGLSVGDILNSLAVLISPFASPKDNPDAIFSTGNVRSCEITGIFLQIGGCMVPLYTLFLTYYFLKRVKYKTSPADFAKYQEKIIKILILLFAVGTAAVAFMRGDFNATAYGSMCVIAPRPFDCVENEEVECTRGENSNILVLLGQIIPFALCFISMLCILGALTYYVYISERQLQPSNKNRTKGGQENNEAVPVRRRPGSVVAVSIDPLNIKRLEALSRAKNASSTPSESRKEDNFDDDHTDQVVAQIESGADKENESPNPVANDESNNEAEQKEVQRMKLTKAAARQSARYIFAFVLVYTGPLIEMGTTVAKINNNEVSFWISSLFYPIGGLLNMLVYTRPKVKALKKLLPELPLYGCFFIVVANGGEVPSLADLLSESSSSSSVYVRRDEAPDRRKESSIASWIKKFGWDISYSSGEIESEVERIMKCLDQPQVRVDEDEGDGRKEGNIDI